MRKALRAMALVVSVLSLGGCGGSETSEPARFVFNTFVGLWINGCEPDMSGGSQNIHIRLTELSADSLSGTFTVRTYPNAMCSGTPTSTVQFGMQQNGTGTVGSDLVIMVTIAAGTSASGFNLISVRNGNLYLGDTRTRGSDGYPTAIDFNKPLVLN